MALLGVAILAFAGIVSAEGASAADTLRGVWGGQRLQLVLDANGGRLDADCANGTIGAPVTPDADGRFVAHGHFETHAVGPQPGDPAAPGMAGAGDPARFSGRVEGDRLWLDILPAGASTPERFELRRGVKVKRVRCL
ncbi:MAG: hypothetical protein ABIN96_10350 [Rubrivivax sp.]